MLVPRAIGSKIDTAGWANTSFGSVREGMWVVIFLERTEGLPVFSQSL